NVLPWRMMKMRRMGLDSKWRRVAMSSNQRLDALDIGFGVYAGAVEQGRIDGDGGDGDAKFDQAQLFKPFKIFERCRWGLFEPGEGAERVAIKTDMTPDRRDRLAGAQSLFVADRGNDVFRKPEGAAIGRAGA